LPKNAIVSNAADQTMVIVSQVLLRVGDAIMYIVVYSIYDDTDP